MFTTYLKLGFDHILDFNGYDHMLFLLALCAVFSLKSWKKVAVLVTAFTLGHCVTLVLSGLKFIEIDADLVEFLIPLTILITAIFNVSLFKKGAYISWHYILAGFFGLIHGLGFSNYFKAMLMEDESLVETLFAFNIGVELGQLVIVMVILLASSFLTYVNVPQKFINWTYSGIAAVVSLLLILNVV